MASCSVFSKLRPLRPSIVIYRSSRPFSVAHVKLQKISDQVDLGKCTKEHDETVYQGILSTQIKLVKGFSLMTSAIGMSCQPLLFYHMQNGANTALAIGAGAFLSFFTFATPLLIHSISKKYVTELNYNKLEDTYTAITYSLFLRRKEIKFKLQDVQVTDGMFSTFQAKNVPLFVDGGQFYKLEHYGKIMGYEKTTVWDHELQSQENPDKKE